MREEGTIDLEALLERQAATLATAAHELKAPLSLMRMYSARMADESLDELQKQQYSSRLLFTVEQMLCLTEGLVEGFRWGQERLPLEPVNTAVMCEQVCHELAAAAAEFDQELVFLLPRSKTVVIGHPVLLKNVLYNIIYNAIKHTPAQTKVTLSLRRQAELSSIDIIDTGPGFTKDMIRQINKTARNRLQATSSRSGSGLGLAVARQLVRAMGGHFQLKRSSRGGYCVVSLPISRQMPLLS